MLIQIFVFFGLWRLLFSLPMGYLQRRVIPEGHSIEEHKLYGYSHLNEVDIPKDIMSNSIADTTRLLAFWKRQQTTKIDKRDNCLETITRVIATCGNPKSMQLYLRNLCNDIDMCSQIGDWDKKYRCMTVQTQCE